MKQNWKRIGCIFFALCLVLTLLPTVALANDVNTLKSTIEAYTGGIGSLSAEVSADGSTVTVTGTVTDATLPLTLEISADVRVIWKASISSTETFTGYLVTVKGEGIFEVAQGGMISSTLSTSLFNESTGEVLVSGGTVSSENYAIWNTSTGEVKVSDGMVENTGSGSAICNNSTGVVRISGDAIVKNKAKYSPTIEQNNRGVDTADRIIIEGGIVKNDDFSNAIENASAGGVRISDGLVSSNGGYTLYNSSTGNISISGGRVENIGPGVAIYNTASGLIRVSGGTVSAISNFAIRNDSDGVIRVSGDAVVQTEGESTIKQDNHGTDNAADRIIIEGGTVKNTGSKNAIYNASAGGVSVSGGTVSAITGSAISNASAGLVRVSGNATVENDSNLYATISLMNSSEDTAECLVVNGGTVKNAGNNAAISNSSAGGIRVNGGIVISSNGEAIKNSSTGTIEISGGIVLAPGSSFANIIHVGKASFSESDITGTGVMIAVDREAFAQKQNSGTSTNLYLWKMGGEESPVSSTEWARQNGVNGLLVSSYEPDVFVPLDKVAVALAPKSTDFTAPDSLIYDGTAKAYTMPSDMEASLYYEGLAPTVYASSTIAPTDAGSYKVSANVVENDVYSAADNLEIATMVIVPKTITSGMIAEIDPQSYTGQKISPIVTVTDGRLLVKDTDYSLSYSEQATVVDGGTVRVTGLGNYQGSVTKSFSVTPLELMIGGATIESKTYDGTKTATVSSVSLNGDVDNMVLGRDFKATGTFDDENAGSNKSVLIDITLMNTDKAANYYILDGNYTLTGQAIAKGIVPMTLDTIIFHRNTLTGEKTVSIASMLPPIEGAMSFAKGSEIDSDNIIADWSVDANGLVNYTLTGGSVGNTATIPILVSAPNYQDFTRNVRITLIDKVVPSVEVEDIFASYGDPLLIQAIVTVDSNPVAGTWSFVSDISSLAIGPNLVMVKFIPTDFDLYAEVTREITVSLSKATPTGEPKYTKITTSEKTLADAALTTEGGTFNVPGIVDWVLDENTTVEKNTAYSWQFTPTDTIHYNTLSGSIVVYPYTSASSSSSSGRTSTTTPSPSVKGSRAISTVAAETSLDGMAKALVTKSQMSKAIAAAQEAAKKIGEAPQLEIQVTDDSGASSLEILMPQSSVEALVTGEIESLTLSSSHASMTFDVQALATIGDVASGDVAFRVTRLENSSLSNEAKRVVGNHPVYDLSVTSGGESIAQFDGTAKVLLPYTLAAKEDPKAIVAYYVNADGELELMQNCYYDFEAEALVFTTKHFSTYAVGYNKIAFSDVSDSAWYFDAVTYLAARGVTSGTTENTFSPDATLSRGQFITLLLRAYDIAPDDSSFDNFSDAGNTYYTGYLAAAKRLTISSGVGDNLFAPEKAITREEMFTLLYNALKVLDQLPEGDFGSRLSDFTDNASTSSYAQEAMDYLVKTGVVSGNKGYLSPKDTTTRAQMVQVLYNLLSI